MRYIAPVVRTQAQLLADVEARLRDTGNSRWTDAELMRAINDGLTAWHGRVLTPFLYAFTLTEGERVYALPAYMTELMLVQAERGQDTDVWWTDLQFDVEPDGEGGQQLRLVKKPAAGDGRIIWWGANGHLPATAPTVHTGGITDASTSLTLSASVDVGRSGYVKVGAEVMAYAGTTDDGTRTTLTNLTRGALGTTAAAALAGVTVYFCVAAPEPRLWEQLYAGACAAALTCAPGSPSRAAGSFP